jgi:hypothetical protein
VNAFGLSNIFASGAACAATRKSDSHDFFNYVFNEDGMRLAFEMMQ